MSERTIFALSVSPGRSALHVTRASGEDLFEKVAALFPGSSKIKEFFSETSLRRRDVFYEKIVAADGQLIDDAVVTVFRGPHSYTGEHTLELSTHGNPLITARLHRRLRELGLVEALPGEFTQRAYLNGKKDLAQSEAIHQLITAESEAGIELARSVAEGSLTVEVRALRQQLLEAMAYLEAHIDFEESDVGVFDGQGLVPGLKSVSQRLADLALSYEIGQKIRSGLLTVLCGSPNAGKSSLFNSLLNTDRAIVTDVPGTTRDFLEEKISINGRDFVLVDTAGLRETRDLVEKLGVERSLKRVEDSDILLCAIDSSLPLDSVNLELSNALDLASKSKPKAFFVVLTKIDLKETEELEILRAHCWNVLKSPGRLADKIRKECLSCSLSDISSIQSALKSAFDDCGYAKMSERQPFLIAARQKDAVLSSQRGIEECLVLIGSHDYPEKMASCLQAATHDLSSILGDISVEEILGQVFSTFCIGK